MASSYCAPLSARAPSFIPRRASPFDTAASTSNCRQDSDCGSSSGLGGMKTQELASDEGGSSSSGAQAYNNGTAPPFMPRPSGLPFCMPPHMGITTTSQTLPTWVQPTPPGVNNDLFVHVQSGETLSVCIGNEMKNITGPATVRMVGESGISPHALPIQVPPGHLIHQIVDEQGILRHLILSPERPSTNYPPSVATPSSGCNRLVSPPPPAATMTYHNNFYTVSRPHEKKYYSYHEESTEGEVDSEEQERFKDMLSRIQPPKVVRVDATTADIEWEEIDTSEASAPGGPFPQIDRSEFIYHIVLFEGSGKFIANYPCDASAGNQMRLCELRPFTDYYVQLKASLDERGVLGEPSETVSFKTAPFRPEPPLLLKVCGKGSDWFALAWRYNAENGSPVSHYNVYLDRGDGNEKVWTGSRVEARVTGLKPATTYYVRVTACNKFGESSDANVTVSTKAEGAPPAPAAPQLILATNRGVKLVWSTIPEFTYSVEMLDMTTEVSTVVREKNAAGNIFISELVPGHQYRFRIRAHNVEGDSPWSEGVTTRATGGKFAAKIPEDRIIVPGKPFIMGQNKTKTTIGWQCPGAREREFEYHLEGSSYEFPFKYRTLYKGPQMTYLLTEEEIQNIRVHSINKKGQHSTLSETLILQREEEDDIVRPEQPQAPVLDTKGRGSMEISWKPTSVCIPSTAKILYEVKRLDTRPELIYCGPETSCAVFNLSNREHIEVQVRSVVVDKNGLRFESDWSPVTGGTAPVEVPPSPLDLHISSDGSTLCWRMPETPLTIRYRVYCSELADGAQECVYESVEPSYTLSRLGYAKKYICRVSAISSDGAESDSTVAIQCITPPGVPAQPEAVSVEADTTSTLLLKWTAPYCRGDPIQQYRIRIESRSEATREYNVLISTYPQCEYRIQDLKPDTRYRIEISAQNSVGSGVSAAISGKTKALPPLAPRLEAEAEPFSLKLKWKPEATHNFMTYRLVRLGENENQEVVYEGDQCFWKMKNLCENTEYRFQIRAIDKVTGGGPWSEVYVFSTQLAQPPPIRQSPTAQPAGQGLYQVEWTPIIGKPNSRQCFYRLQAIDCVAEGAKWHSVYEGLLTNYTVRVSEYPGALQIRVCIVRPRDDGREVVGSPSPIVYIANTPAKRKASEVEVEPPPPAPRSPFAWLRFGSDKGITIISVMLFAVLSCSIALFFDQLYIRSPDT